MKYSSEIFSLNSDLEIAIDKQQVVLIRGDKETILEEGTVILYNCH